MVKILCGSVLWFNLVMVLSETVWFTFRFGLSFGSGFERLHPTRSILHLCSHSCQKFCIQSCVNLFKHLKLQEEAGQLKIKNFSQCSLCFHTVVFQNARNILHNRSMSMNINITRDHGVTVVVSGALGAVPMGGHVGVAFTAELPVAGCARRDALAAEAAGSTRPHAQVRPRVEAAPPLAQPSTVCNHNVIVKFVSILHEAWKGRERSSQVKYEKKNIPRSGKSLLLAPFTTTTTCRCNRNNHSHLWVSMED